MVLYKHTCNYFDAEDWAAGVPFEIQVTEVEVVERPGSYLPVNKDVPLYGNSKKINKSALGTLLMGKTIMITETPDKAKYIELLKEHYGAEAAKVREEMNYLEGLMTGLNACSE